MKEPEDKKEKAPESKPGVTPGKKNDKAADAVRRPHPEVAPEQERYIPEKPGTITEVAPETRHSGPIKEMAPDVSKIRPEVAPDLKLSRPGPIQEMAPDVGPHIHPEVAPEVAGAHPGQPVSLLYGPVIHGAIAEGNLARMRTVAQQAEQQLNQWGDLRTALEVLKVEIARLEYKQRGR